MNVFHLAARSLFRCHCACCADSASRHDAAFLGMVKGLPWDAQDLKFDGEASGTPDPKRSKETVKQGEVRESNALPGESPEKKKVRFLPEPGDGGPLPHGGRVG